MAQYGIAPMAAMSERFTASALCPRFSGSTSGKKCVPATMVSVETASSMPRDRPTSAQSSPTPSTALVAGRVKWRAISSDSGASCVMARLSLFRDPVGAHRAGQPVEHAVHVLVPIGAAVALAQLDGLVDRHSVRNLRVVHQLPGAQQQDGALHGAHVVPLAVGERLQLRAQ